MRRDFARFGLVAAATALAIAAGALAHEADTAVQRAAGVQVYVDPDTGEITAPPDDAVDAHPRARAIAPTDDVEVPSEAASRTPGGGYVVNLRGRARFHLTGSVSEDGRAEVLCEEGFTSTGGRP
jgi:hypothetical protein